jgi:outer membrane protein OmpA-like peptidoglycan-associated protein
MVQKLHFSIMVLLLATVLFSLGNAGDYTLGLKGGMSTYFGDIDDQHISPYGGLSFDAWLVPQVGIGLLGYAAHIQGKETDPAFYFFESLIYGGGVLVKVRPLGKTVVSPYLMGGAEMFMYDPTDGDGNALPNSEAEEYDKYQLGFPLGGGISFFVKENLSLDVEALYHYASNDWLDDLKSGDGDDGFLTASLGISFHFGKPKDTDLDGIFDKYDLDPLNPEDFDGFQDEDGAPDLDNDEDGIPDSVDKAPLKAEDKDGYQDEDGVPDPDNDADGIVDSEDGAPNEAEDVDGFMDQDGIPDPDNDGDGIADAQDKCPGTDKTVADGIDTKETMNGYEDTDGCPDKKPEIAVEAGKAIVLEGVNFASGSAKLSAGSQSTLDKVVRTLKENPTIEVEIRGYTDNTGKYESNVKLSQARADAVKVYLIENGIDAARVKTKGFGPEDPIAPNDTKAGRAQNRRIEFFRIK